LRLVNLDKFDPINRLIPLSSTNRIIYILREVFVCCCSLNNLNFFFHFRGIHFRGGLRVDPAAEDQDCSKVRTGERSGGSQKKIQEKINSKPLVLHYYKTLFIIDFWPKQSSIVIPSLLKYVLKILAIKF
jgi:hypothetical protein